MLRPQRSFSFERVLFKSFVSLPAVVTGDPPTARDDLFRELREDSPAAASDSELRLAVRLTKTRISNPVYLTMYQK